MPYDQYDLISFEEADQIAQQLTDGEVSVHAEANRVWLQRKGFETVIELLPEKLTEVGLTADLEDWKQWPKP